MESLDPNAESGSDHLPITDRKRSYWRGLVAGLTAKLLLLAVIVVCTYFLRPFVWTALSSAPYETGAIDPNSGEWMFMQLLGFIASLVAGAAIARWSRRGTWSALATYAALTLVLVLVMVFPATESVPRLLIWVFEVPLGVLCGGLIYMRYEGKISA